MNLSQFVRQRLQELRVDQRGLAGAAQVTDSYISQLLSGRKAPPAPERTDVYGRMEAFLKVPVGTLAALAELQRTEAAKRRLADPPAPLFREVRALVVGKCRPGTRPAIRAAFEREAFGDLERLVTRKLLDLVQRVVSELKDEEAVDRIARLTGRSYEQVRVTELEFLETDVFNVTAEHCATFLDPLIEEWDIDLTTFAMEVVLNGRVSAGHSRTLEFVERQAGASVEEEPGLRAFLDDPALSGDASGEEIAFLRALRFTGRRPTPLYYYRELQSLRDPLHFRATEGEKPATRR
jgi:transcriptional regulator with XRE-family HTH domain